MENVDGQDGNILYVTLGGHGGHSFSQLIRALPDGEQWLISDPQGSVVIARSEGEVIREAICAPVDGNLFEIECLASRPVDLLLLQGLVAGALFAGAIAVGVTWWAELPGIWGVLAGISVAGAVPSMILALGQRFLVPEREHALEHELLVAVCQATDQLPFVRLSAEPVEPV